jgi:DNA-binding XRE family transcriptional regulator
VRVLGLVDLAQALARLEPPPAYRLSLDSGIEYKNVRRTLAQPLAARLDTWQRLLRSLQLRPIAVARASGGAGGGQRPAGACACQRAAVMEPASLRGLRETRGWSRREMARRTGLGVDAIGALEKGRGMVGSLLRAYAALDLELVLALPPEQASLADLWRERAGRCLESPAQFPRRAPRRPSKRPVEAA